MPTNCFAAKQLPQFYKMCIRDRCIPVHTLLFELLIAAFVDRIADVLHEMIVEIKIMQDAQTHTEHLLRLEQVANICPAVMAAGRTLTSLLDRTVIQLIFGIKEVQLAVLCIDMSVTAVSGRINAVKEIHATVDGLQNIQRCAEMCIRDST